MGEAGSIPACAGEPRSSRVDLRACRVYPRVCGGTRTRMTYAIPFEGLSPRVRGNLGHARFDHRGSGSIPACAGEPPTWSRPRPRSRVYPRVCGGTACVEVQRLCIGGLSPRVRGNRGRPAACTARCGVYPRVCGGTALSAALPLLALGLSPRVRGNLARLARAGAHPGSIPACAGEPLPSAFSGCLLSVYPRVCGGTAVEAVAESIQAGLSPRVRGNRHHRGGGGNHVGSIPACAGEPRAATVPVCARRVYPRVCGGTSGSSTGETMATGLSPRVRGNRCTSRRRCRRAGSIPACAGEPLGSALVCRGAGVYPRVCGGTYAERLSGLDDVGLSPRVRGNHQNIAPLPHKLGSIPACAGEPADPLHEGGSTRVYPRVCGGTGEVERIKRDPEGLSPRVRGNLHRAVLCHRRVGSIPACAGEPP